MKTRIRVSRAGLASRRHDERLRRASGRARDVRRSVRGARRGPVGAGRERPAEALNADRQHAAGDAHRRRRGVARVAARRAAPQPAWSPGTASANTRRSSPPARSRFATRCRWCAFARRRCRRRCPRAPARWRRSSGCDDDAVARGVRARRRRAQVVEAVNFNAPGQVVIAGHSDGGRARDRRSRRQKGAKRARDAAGDARRSTASLLQPGGGAARANACAESRSTRPRSR